MKLERLLALRKKIQQLEQEINDLMPEAIGEALELISNQGKQIALENELGKIVVVMRRKFNSPKDDLILAKLDTDIKAELSKLALTHSTKLSAIDNSITNLENELAILKNKQENLLSSRYLIKLKKQYQEHQQSTEYLVPSLSIFLNKSTASQ